jgi:hypothetical protein
MIPDNAPGAGFFGKYLGYMGTNLSPALLGVGYIVGLNIGIVVLSGSILVLQHRDPDLSRVLLKFGDPESRQAPRRQGAAEAAARSGGEKIRYLGVGAMLIGGIWTLFSLRKSLLSGVKSGIAAARKGAGAQPGRNRARPADEVDADRAGAVRAAAAGAVPGHRRQLDREHADDDHHDRRRLPVRVGVGVSRRPGRFVEQSGVGHHHRHHPVRLGGVDAAAGAATPRSGAVAAIMIGAVVCCAAAVGGDNLQDLKAGYLVGATPWKQQLMLGIGAFSCALIMAPVLNLLAQAYGIGAPTPHPGPLQRAAGHADGLGGARACSAASCRGHHRHRRGDRRGRSSRSTTG